MDSSFSFSSGRSYSSGISETVTKFDDKVEGIYLQLSKPDREGGVLKRNYKDGRIPKQKEWSEYEEQKETNELPEGCEVLGFDGESVRLSCSSGATNYPISSFNETDQKTIKKRVSNKDFMSSSKLSINIKGIKEHAEVSGYADCLIRYAITVENRSTCEMKDLTVKYRIFHQELSSSSKLNLSKTLFSGDQFFDLASGEKKIVYTQAGTENGISRPAPVGGTYTTPGARVEGIHLQLKKSNSPERPAERSYKEGAVPPEGKWREYSKKEKRGAKNIDRFDAAEGITGSQLYLGEINGLSEEYKVRSFDGESVQLSCSSGTTNRPIRSFTDKPHPSFCRWVRGFWRVACRRRV